eukprot:8707596-Pyramimonas_sp.AAC.1
MKRLICAACLHISKPCELEICTALISRRGDEFEAKELYRTRSLICGGHGGVRTAPSCYWPYRDYVLNSSDPNASRDFPPMEKKWRDLMYVQPHPLFIQFHMPVHMGFAYWIANVLIGSVLWYPHFRSQTRDCSGPQASQVCHPSRFRRTFWLVLPLIYGWLRRRFSCASVGGEEEDEKYVLVSKPTTQNNYQQRPAARFAVGRAEKKK